MLTFRYVFKDFEKDVFVYKIWTLSEIENGSVKNFLQTEKNQHLDKYSVDLLSTYLDKNNKILTVNDIVNCPANPFHNYTVGYDLKNGFYLYNSEHRVLLQPFINNAHLLENCEIIGNVYSPE